MICPRCKNDALKEEHEFCFKCGLNLRAVETKSPPLSQRDKAASKELDQIEQNSDVNTSDSTETLHGKS